MRKRGEHRDGCPCVFCCGRPPLMERYWNQVERLRPDDCWPWLGVPVGNYGRIRLGGGQPKVPATWVAWFFEHGMYPKLGMDVCHTCDNPLCQNPAHLFLGTARDNFHDMMRKGRANFARARAFAAQTHCANGHEFTEANTHKSKYGRKCRTCDRIVHRKRAALYGWRPKSRVTTDEAAGG